MDNEKTGISWPVVIFILFVFFPLGIPLIILKIGNEKKKYDKNARVMTVLGIVIIMVWVLYALISVTIEPMWTVSLLGRIMVLLLSGIIMVAGGIILLCFAVKYRRKSRIFSQYADYINIAGITDIDILSDKMSRSAEAVCMDVREMIDAGIFTCISVDDAGHKIVRNENNDIINCEK